jgi:GNAT superfamily N-acetyltransferase
MPRGIARYHRDVRQLGIGWATDLAVLELSGSSVDDRGDHLIVRTPRNPTYNWGNCIFVTDPAAVDDAHRWVRIFTTTFPSATWTAIGLPRLPTDAAAWAAHELELELDEVLVASTLPHQTALPDGYVVRRLAGDDWVEDLALAITENTRTGDSEADAYASFARARSEAQRALSDSNAGAYFGVFADGRVVASLGIVRCGAIGRYQIGRYQNVLTDANHRGRGLASHLIGVAARWTAAFRCDRWVIITEAGNPAERVYRRLGLEPHSTNVQAYRRHPR